MLFQWKILAQSHIGIWNTDETSVYVGFPISSTSSITSYDYTDYILSNSLETYQTTQKTFIRATYNSNVDLYCNSLPLKTYPIVVHKGESNSDAWYFDHFTIFPYKLSSASTIGSSAVYQTFNEVWVKENKYTIASTQLTLGEANQLPPEIIGYGKNGIVTGDGSLYENLDPAQVLQKVMTMEDTQTQHREIYGEQNTNIIGPGFGTGLKPGVLKHYKTISNSNDLGMGFGRLADKSSTTYKLSEDGSKAISFGSLTTGLGATVTDVTTGSTLLEISNAQYLGCIGDKVYYSKMGYSGRSLSAKRYNYGPMTYASDKRDLQVYYLDLETLTETKINFDMVTATSWKNIEHSILMYGEMMVYISWANTESGTRKEQVIYQVYNTSTNTLYNSVNYTKTMATSQSNNGACVCPDQNRNIYIWHFGLYNSSSSSTMYTDVYKFDYSTKAFTKILTNLVIPSGGYMDNCKGYLTNDNKLFIVNNNTNRYLDLTNNTLNNITVQFQNCSQFFVKPESFNPYSSYVSFDYDTLQYYYKNYLGFVLLQPSVSGTTITFTGVNCVRFAFPRLYEMAGTYTNSLDWFYRDGNKFIISKMCPYIPTDTLVKICEECDYDESEFSAINTEINEDWSEQNVQLFKKYQLDDSDTPEPDYTQLIANARDSLWAYLNQQSLIGAEENLEDYYEQDPTVFNDEIVRFYLTSGMGTWDVDTEGNCTSVEPNEAPMVDDF